MGVYVLGLVLSDAFSVSLRVVVVLYLLWMICLGGGLELLVSGSSWSLVCCGLWCLLVSVVCWSLEVLVS